MENDILGKYYEGIMNELRGEVDCVNELLLHQGLKGEGNEGAIRRLLKRFIPRRFGIGSGIVIDREGRQSKQCDIVIYDHYTYPEILSLTSAHIYPVDLVYATIEVKTTLDSGKARQAIDNIKSVRGLNYIRESYRVWPTDSPELSAATELWRVVETNAPVGIIFGYRSNTHNYDTFAAWFKNQEDEATSTWPSHVVCLDQGMIIAPGWPQRTCLALPFIFGDHFHCAEEEEITTINNKEWCEHSGRLFPISQMKGQKVLIDQSKTLLHFVLSLPELLKNRHISPNINFHTSYLSAPSATTFVVPEAEEDGLKVFTLNNRDTVVPSK